MKLVGERRALAAAILGFYALVYAAFAILGMVGPMSNALYALAFCYGLAFFGLVAGYFWARWFAVGVALFGVIQGALGIWQVGTEPVVIFLAATHVFATAALWGNAMAVPYDGQSAWREKFHMDENAVRRLGNSVIKAGASLPVVLLYALAPKQPSSAIVVIAAVICSAFGLRGLIKAKTWGVIALGLAGAIMATVGATHMALVPAISGALLLSAAAPFLLPMLRYVRTV